MVVKPSGVENEGCSVDFVAVVNEVGVAAEAVSDEAVVEYDVSVRTVAAEVSEGDVAVDVVEAENCSVD